MHRAGTEMPPLRTPHKRNRVVVSGLSKPEGAGEGVLRGGTSLLALVFRRYFLPIYGFFFLLQIGRCEIMCECLVWEREGLCVSVRYVGGMGWPVMVF